MLGTDSLNLHESKAKQHFVLLETNPMEDPLTNSIRAAGMW